MSAAAACLRPSGLPGEKGPCQPWRVGWGRPRQDGRPLEGLPAPPCHGEGSATTPLPNVCLVGIPLGRRLPAPLPDVCLFGIWDADFRPLSRISASSGFGTSTFGSSPGLMPRRDSSRTPTPSLSHIGRLVVAIRSASGRPRLPSRLPCPRFWSATVRKLGQKPRLSRPETFQRVPSG